MRIIWLCLPLAALAAVTPSRGQGSGEDSAKTYQLREYVVTATRSEIRLNDSPFHIDLLTSDDIANTNSSTVGDALGQGSSMFLKQYGPEGALQTLSMRGGASEHVLLLVNGNRLNSFQNGLVDASLLPLSDVDRIEILYGGSSALYGADALGGVVNILTKKPAPGYHVRTEGATGSFGLQRYLLESGDRTGSVGVLCGYGSERGRNDFSYDVPSAGGGYLTTRRDNADFYRRQWYLEGTVDAGERSEAGLSAQYVLADRGTPSPLSPLARQSDDDVNCSLRYRDGVDSGTVWKISSSVHYNLEHYNDPNPLYPYQTFYKSMYLDLDPQVHLALSDHQAVTLGAELSQGTLEGPDFDAAITRVQKALYASSESRFDYRRQLFNRIVFFQSLRYDRISDVDAALTPKVGVLVRVTSVADVQVRGSIGESFRAPSFNDLYYRGFSNPDLKPERSKSFDAGCSLTFQCSGVHSFEYTYFHQDIDDRILFDLTTFLPMNIGKVLAEGSEVKYTGSFGGGRLHLKLHYSFTDARDRSSASDPAFNRQLLYTPVDLLNLGFGVNASPVLINILYSFVGGRYLTPDNSSSLPSYRVTDANVVTKQRLGAWSIEVKAEVNNIFDQAYEVFNGYPIPGRNYRLTFVCEY